MTRFLLLLFCVTMIFACKPGIPKDIVQPAEMEKILFDIHVVDGYVSTIPTPDSARKISSPIYKGVFKKYGIDSAMHAKSMAYYYRHPDILGKMYDKISGRLEKAREEEIKREEKEAKASAKKAKAVDTISLKPVDTPKKAVENKQIDTSKKVKPLKQTKIFRNKTTPSAKK